MAHVPKKSATSPVHYPFSMYSRALGFSKEFRARLAMAVLRSLLVSVISLVPLVALKLIIDDVFVVGRTDLLNYVLIGVLVVSLLGLGIDCFHSIRTVRLLQAIKLKVVGEVFAHLQRVPLGFFDRHRIGELVYRVHTDTSTVDTAAGSQLIGLATNLGIFLVVVSLMFWLNWKLALLSFVVMGLHVLLVVSFRGALAEHGRRLINSDEQILAETTEYYAGVRTVRAFGRENHELGRFSQRIQTRNRLAIESNVTNLFSGSVMAFLNTAWILILLWVGGHQVMEGKLTVGGLMVFFVVAGRLFGTVSAMTQWFLGLQLTLVGVDRVFRILDERIASAELEQGVTLPPVEGRIEFRDVRFAYDSERPVLKGVDFSIEPGMSVALMGRSGVGKSTIINLILGFYAPQGGEVLVDGHDLAGVSAKSLRSQLGVVFQEPFLTSGTVRQNIAYSVDGPVPLDRIVEVAKAANAHEFITALPDSYETRLGERGVELSAGEKQRITIARALLRDPRILLLDEPTSALDLHTESLIQNALAGLVRGRTCLIVAHRLSTIRRTDRILLLEDGRIIEAGTHDELLDRGGAYAEIYEKQAII